ncbi:MAG: GntR family transcriptional regulator [Brachybacterium sp.]|nr:GntR family transcriptional regulator [Brachybacterium sp.]
MTPTDGGRPIFLELADRIAEDILGGIYPPGTQVPSTTELSAFYRINPATAGKALNRLVDAGILTKRRGLGTFVTEQGPECLREERRQQFAEDYLTPMLQEARRLEITRSDLLALLREHPDPEERP